MAKAKTKAKTADTNPTDVLLSIVGKKLTDKTVKEVLAAHELPLAEKHDLYGRDELGVSYQLSKIPVGGKRASAIKFVAFHNKGDVEWSHALSRELKFKQYAGALPRDIAWTDDKKALKKKVGAFETEHDDYVDWIYPDENRRLSVRLEKGKIANVAWGVLDIG